MPWLGGLGALLAGRQGLYVRVFGGSLVLVQDFADRWRNSRHGAADRSDSCLGAIPTPNIRPAHSVLVIAAADTHSRRGSLITCATTHRARSWCNCEGTSVTLMWLSDVLTSSCACCWRPAAVDGSKPTNAFAHYYDAKPHQYYGHAGLWCALPHDLARGKTRPVAARD